MRQPKLTAKSKTADMDSATKVAPQVPSTSVSTTFPNANEAPMNVSSSSFAQFLPSSMVAQAALIQQLQFQHANLTQQQTKPLLNTNPIKTLDESNNTVVRRAGGRAKPVQTRDGLDSIASVAVAVAAAAAAEEEHNEKSQRLKKRRSQIAAASRKSRAKRKFELTKLRHENESLWKQNVMLTTRLRQLGETIPDPQQLSDDVMQRSSMSLSNYDGNASDDTEKSNAQSSTCNDRVKMSEDGGGETTTPSKESSNSQGHTDVGKTALLLGTSAVGPDSVTDIEGSAKRRKLVGATQVEFEQVENMKEFFAARMSWFFTQLKSDTVAQFGRSLPFHVKQQVANLQLAILEGKDKPAQPQPEKSEDEKIIPTATA